MAAAEQSVKAAAANAAGLEWEPLRQAAQAATPGPWVVDREAVRVPGDVDRICSMQVSNQPNWDHDAAFIAAANPATVLALLNRIAGLEAAVAEHRAPAANAAGLSLQQVADRISGQGIMSPVEFRRFLNGDGVEMYPHQLLRMVNLFITDRAAAVGANGLRVDYYARFPEGESWAQVSEEQYEMAQRMGYDVRTNAPAMSAAGRSDMGALEIACAVNKKLGHALAGRSYLLSDDLDALKRFEECATDFDSGGHDLSKEAMARLREIGVVQSIGFGRHQTTAFGDYVLERCEGEPVNLPLKTLAERNEDARAAANGAGGQA